MSRKLSKILAQLIPILIFFWAGNRLVWAYRIAPGTKTNDKLSHFLPCFVKGLTSFITFHLPELIGGAVAVGVFLLVQWDKKQNKKQFRTGREHGSAKWGNADTMTPFTNPVFEQNIILTQTEHLTLGSGKGKDDRNKNICVLGASGSGKTRFHVKPNLMQLHSSYVVTDPKGSLLHECGKMMQNHGYRVRVFNTIDFDQSHGYNPFTYFREDHFTEDLAKFLDVLVNSTSGGQAPGGDKFWLDNEKIVYSAYIALIFVVCAPKDRNMAFLCALVNHSKASESDENAKSRVDVIFDALELWLKDEMTPEKSALFDGIHMDERATDWQKEIGAFAMENYRAFKQAGGKTAKSIFSSCEARLAPFRTRGVKNMTMKDELQLDKIGDRKTILFIIISDTSSTYNFLVAMLYSQLFDVLCDKARLSPKGKLKVHVRCILDEFANIGLIPDFEKKISVFRSREISACVILQAMSQLKSVYKDNADTIVANCDSLLFLGSPEMPTLEFISKLIGSETIDTRSTSLSRGASGSYSRSEQKSKRELMTPDELRVMDGSKCVLVIRGVDPFFSNKYEITKHKRYRELSDADEKNHFDFSDIKTKRPPPPKEQRVQNYDPEQHLNVYNL